MGECVDEMHNLGFLVRAGAHDIRDYLAANYCPTVEANQQDFCIEKLARYYIGMLDAIVHHYFMDGAVHVCQTMGVCDAFRSGRYTCEECVQGLEWVENYIEDPIMIAEYVVYLEQNFCQDDWEGCKEHAIQDFPAMHNMAMEKFFMSVPGLRFCLCSPESIEGRCCGRDTAELYQ